MADNYEHWEKNVWSFLLKETTATVDAPPKKEIVKINQDKK